MIKILLALLVLAPTSSFAESEVKKEAAELGTAIKKDSKKIAGKVKEGARKVKSKAKEGWRKTKKYIHEKTAD